MSITFRIQKGRGNKLGKTVVLVGVTWQGERVFVSSGQLSNPVAFTPHWPENERPIDAQLISDLDINSVELNEYFSRLKSAIEENFLILERLCGRAKTITPDMMRKMVKNLLAPPEPEAVDDPAPAKNIWRYYEEWLLHNRHKLSKKHLHRFDNIWHWLDEYAPGLELVVLDEEWVREFANWVLENENPFTDEPAHDGTICKHVSFFRTMLEFAKMPYEWLDNIAVATMPVVTLNYPELLAIRNTTFLGAGWHTDEELRQTADQYLLLTQLGISYGDWRRMAQEDVELVTVRGRPQLVLNRRQLTRKAHLPTILLSDLAEEIWRQYAGKFDKIPKQAFNGRLKHIGYATRLTREIVSNTNSSYTSPITRRPLWCLLTARTARHTSAALLLKGHGRKEVGQSTLGTIHQASTNIWVQVKNLQKIADSLGTWDTSEHMN